MTIRTQPKDSVMQRYTLVGGIAPGETRSFPKYSTPPLTVDVCVREDHPFFDTVENTQPVFVVRGGNPETLVTVRYYRVKHFERYWYFYDTRQGKEQLLDELELSYREGHEI